MTKILGIGLMAIATASSQSLVGVQTISSAPPQTTSRASVPGRNIEAARPLLGYVTNGSNILYSVVGSAASPLWGEPLSLPDPTAVVFLPPRQEYALLASQAGLSVARLSRSALYPGVVLSGAMAHPERVEFSPSGESAALFSSAEGRVQVLTYVAGQAQLHWTVPVPNPIDLLRFTISDDGKLLVAAFPNRPAVFSLQGGAWQQLPTTYRPDAWTFLPESHALVLSDTSRQAIVVLPQVEQSTIAERVLASGGVKANLLSANKQGNQLLAVAVGTTASWSIDLVGGGITPLPGKGKIDSLTLLRDGQTFLVSMQTAPLLLKLSGSGSGAPQSAAIIPGK